MNRGPHPSKMDTEATAAQADVPDLDLVKKAQEGDSAAFDELVGRYRNRIFGMIYNMVHNEQDAWDLAQDSFLKAWKSIARFRGQSSFYTWLYRIVMNVTIDSLRKRAWLRLPSSSNVSRHCELSQPIGAERSSSGWETVAVFVIS